jgi:hypothetical protein
MRQKVFYELLAFLQIPNKEKLLRQGKQRSKTLCLTFQCEREL